jgi:hypothetical protein
VKKGSLRGSISELYIRQILLDFGFRREGSRPGSLNLRFAPRILYGEGLGKDWKHRHYESSTPQAVRMLICVWTDEPRSSELARFTWAGIQYLPCRFILVPFLQIDLQLFLCECLD